MSDEPAQRDVISARRTLARLCEQANNVRAELRAMRADLAGLRGGAGRHGSTPMQEANEQLVLAALQAETIAKEALCNLDELARASQRDALTDTPNRALMLDRLANAIAMAARRGSRVAVLFLDLDNFKQINDTLGHAIGDAALQVAARRMLRSVRDSDTVCRFGGDEFIIVLAEIKQAADAAVVAGKLLADLAQPCCVGEHVLQLSASLGISVFPEDGATAITLIDKADAAMYRAKNSGSGHFVCSAEQIVEQPGLASTNVNGHAPRTNGGAHSVPSVVRLQQMLEANEQLVIAALSAQELEARAQATHRRQLRFMAVVAHELRNPLNPIRMAASLLDRASKDASQLAGLQRIIERQVAQMSRLVDDLLDESRSSTGKLRIESTSVDLAGILHLAAETCRPAVEARRQHLQLQLPPGALAVHGDPVRLAQVFVNLLDNASKYTGDEGEIVLTATQEADTLTILVRDNGIGISAEALPDIFNLFMQGEQARSLHSDGLGIGLAVVRDLVEAHAGNVVGRSGGEGRGSEFLVTLPRADTARETVPV